MLGGDGGRRAPGGRVLTRGWGTSARFCTRGTALMATGRVKESRAVARTGMARAQPSAAIKRSVREFGVGTKAAVPRSFDDQWVYGAMCKRVCLSA